MTTMLQRLQAPRTFVLASLLLLVSSLAASAMEIKEVTSSKGVKAWLVEDYTVPIIAIRFAFDGGEAQDPAGKEGLTNLMTGLLDEGAGDLDSDAYQNRLDDAGAEMSFTASRDNFYGQMRMLSDQQDEAFDLLALAVNKPRFDQPAMDRIRSQILSGIISDERKPETAAAIKWRQTLYGDHPYARREEGTRETLAALKPDDLHKLHKGLFARENLHVAVVGAIDPEKLKLELDKVFGDLPEKPELVAIADAKPNFGQTITVDYDLPQTSIQLAYPGVTRKAPDFFAAYLMNHILGGGTFTSRLFLEVREARGLAYGVDSGLNIARHSNLVGITTATRSDRAAETLKVIEDVVAKLAKDGPTQTELDEAKKYTIGSYAINNLNSSAAIARTLVELQIDDLGIDYMDRRAALIDAVTLDQVKAAAAKLLTVKPTILTLGPKKAAQ